MSLDKLDSDSGSPYSHGKYWRRRDKPESVEQEYRFSRPINLVNYNRQESCEMHTSPGSPYQIRKPVALWVEQQQQHNRNEESWKSSQESELNLGHNRQDSGRNRRRKTTKHSVVSSERTAEDEIVYSPEEQMQFPLIYQSTHSLHKVGRSRLRRNRKPDGGRTTGSKRAISKKGERNVTLLNLPQKSLRFVKDLVTTLVEVQWRYLLIAFGLSFFCSWILFALLWFLIAYAHGDLFFDPETGERLGDGTQPCVANAKTFAAFLLFSIETQVTTGFGDKVPTEECPEAIFLLIVQIIAGLVIEGAMVGIVYAKLIRPPKSRGAADKRFSKVAVICQRDGKLCFVFRLCDVNYQHAIGTKVSAVMLEQRRSLEGELIEKYESYMKLENRGRFFLLWPVTVCHVIDCDSPLFDISAKDLLEKKFEIVVTISGGTMTTGQVSEAGTSYLPGEIYWGHRFQNIIRYDAANERYIAANEHLDAIEPVDTPLCSARRMEEVLDEVNNFLEHDRQREFDGLECCPEHGERGLEDSDSDDGIQIKQLRIALKKQLENSNQQKPCKVEPCGPAIEDPPDSSANPEEPKKIENS